MEHAKKMVLVDQRVLDSFRSRQVSPLTDITNNKLHNLDQEMKEILSRQDMELKDKADLYQQTLWRFLQQKDSKLQKSEISKDLPSSQVKDEDLSLSKDIIDSVPNSLRKKAEGLIEYLKRHTDLKWNQRGEIVYRGNLISNSNILDLVNDALRKRKSINPDGWETFARVLRESNVPRDLIGHPDRWTYITKGPSLQRAVTAKPEKASTWLTL